MERTSPYHKISQTVRTPQNTKHKSLKKKVNKKPTSILSLEKCDVTAPANTSCDG